MNGCFVGRGQLLVSILGASSGFFSLSGNADIRIDLREDNESVNDARNGRVERVDWYVRNLRTTLEAECFTIEKDAIELLLKASYQPVSADTAVITLPDPLRLGRFYQLKPALIDGTVSVEDDLGNPVAPSNYTVQLPYGLISFNSTNGQPEPFVVSCDWGDHDAFALNSENQVLCQAVFIGKNKVTGQEVMAEFYRLALDISEEMKLVTQGFTGLSVRLQAIPDVSEPLDETLGQYGRIILL